jgi:hypothetical protein
MPRTRQSTPTTVDESGKQTFAADLHDLGRRLAEFANKQPSAVITALAAIAFVALYVPYREFYWSFGATPEGVGLSPVAVLTRGLGPAVAGVIGYLLLRGLRHATQSLWRRLRGLPSVDTSAADEGPNERWARRLGVAGGIVVVGIFIAFLASSLAVRGVKDGKPGLLGNLALNILGINAPCEVVEGRPSPQRGSLAGGDRVLLLGESDESYLVYVPRTEKTVRIATTDVVLSRRVRSRNNLSGC